MRTFNENEINRKFIKKDFIKYGFKNTKNSKNSYIYEKFLSIKNFKVVFNLKDNILTSKVIDIDTNEEYILVDLDTALGKFTTSIKKDYESIIGDILEKCSRSDIFKFNQTKRLIDYVESKYDSKLEFLWKKFPDNAIFRNKETNKWFAAILTAEAHKIDINDDKKLEIVDLKYPKDKITNKVNNKTIFKGFHMNKNHWITIPLDERIKDEELFKLVDLSFKLVS